MDIAKVLNTKTALEYLIFLSNKNVVIVSRDLQITPQQFTDWIKHRRPIPVDRLALLAEYFSLPETTLVDDNRFAKRLSALDRVDLEILIVANQVKSSSAEQKEELTYRMDMLKAEREKQLRIARLSALLEKNDAQVMRKIDLCLKELEAL